MNHASIVLTKWIWRVLASAAIVFFQSLQGLRPAVKMLPLPEPGIAPGWLAFHADAPVSFGNMSQHSLRLSPNSSNYPQIAFGGDHLYYAYKDGRGWHTQTVDSAWNVGSGAALALDAGGKAHISYYDTFNGDLKYATNKSGAWVSQIVVASGDVGAYSDIAIDSWGDPAIVYFNATTAELHYIYYDSQYGGWGQDETVAAAYDMGHPGWFSFALDTSVTPNRPHVSYYLRTTNSIGVVQWAHYNASSAWVHEPVDSCISDISCRLGEYNSLALDPTSAYRPVIAYSYHDYLAGDFVMFTAYDGSKWVPDDTDPEATASYVSLAIDMSGYWHISWRDNSFKYTRRNAQGFAEQTVTLDASTGAGDWSALAVVGTIPKVIHYDSTSSLYEYIGHDQNNWLLPETVATRGHNVGSCTSLAVDGLGRSHISYFDSTSNSILYSRHNSDGSWFKNTIDSAGTAICSSVMAVNPATDDPSVGFIRGGSLWYSLGTISVGTTSWSSPMQVDTGFNTSTYEYQPFGLALASDGAPHFVYRKGSDLWYATWNGSWSRTKLVTGSVGMSTAIALGPGNVPNIAYYQSGMLYYTRYNGGTWLTESIAATGLEGSGFGVALAVDQSGNAMAAYLNDVGTDLRVSTRQCLASPPYTCSWTAGTLLDDEANDNFSLTLDRTGAPHLAVSAYTSAQGLRLDYIARKGNAWFIQAVDTGNWAGGYPSIDLTPAGTARISYNDLGNNDLKFVLMLNKVLLPLIKR